MRCALGRAALVGLARAARHGELRVIFNTLDDSPTRPMVVPEEATQRWKQVNAEKQS